jgi:hypothetical protein
MKMAILALITLVFTCRAYAQTSSTKPAPPSGLTATRGGAQVDSQKAADIRRLLELTGAGGLSAQMMQATEANMRPLIERSLPPGDYRARLIDLYFEKFHTKASAAELVELIVPVYDRHFSDDEIKQLISFYQTPVGKKAIAELPQVLAESQRIGSEWGQRVGRESMDEVLAEHPELKAAMEEAGKQP